MSGMHVNFLDREKDLQDQLDYAEVKLSHKGVDLVPVSGFKKSAREFYYKNTSVRKILGLELTIMCFICRRHNSIYKLSWEIRSSGHSIV